MTWKILPIILLCALNGISQNLLKNPSFEGTISAGLPGKKHDIMAWEDCGSDWFANESPFDIHPGHIFEVKKKPQDGKSYVGLVVRDNYSFEGIQQKIALQKDSCYTLDIYLSKSKDFISASRKSTIKINYINYLDDISLALLGGGVSCPTDILVVSPKVDHHEWRQYSLNFCLDSDIKHLVLAAYSPSLKEDKPVNGHILIDNASLRITPKQ